ncbi:MAG: alpha-hydroxy-acid oxidizing protein [Deltaproteobacteria bacterium]|nr:alpha-hydroxy-acid oxidizing protein [Deltaproteobacteria bacterium]
MARYRCVVCEYVYDEDNNDLPWCELSDDWPCPVCESPKKYYEVIEDAGTGDDTGKAEIETGTDTAQDLLRTFDEFESFMADIHQMAETGQSITEPMRTRNPTFSWDELLIKGAQLSKIPLNKSRTVSTDTIIGPGAAQPLKIAMPVYITHMSFGALSIEAKIALARGSAAVKTAMCSGEGGILPESYQSAYKYIFEYVPNRYSVTDENLKKVDAIEIKIGQSAKPGMGGHFPAEKVTREIANLRGFEMGQPITSPAHFEDIRTRDDLKRKVDWLRDTSEGKPIGIKFAAGNVEADLEVALFAKPDFITIDGRAGATGSAPKFVKASTSVPTIFALYRVRRLMDKLNANNVSVVITGGLRISSDFAKALAMGANAIAIGTTALMAIGCQQYKMCHTGKCPMGIATQNPELRTRLKPEAAAKKLENFLTVSNEELKDFARLTGNADVHGLSLSDLCTTNSEISNFTDIDHV